jgi:hypothetical protein
MKMNEDISVKHFSNFFKGAHFLSFNFDQISWRPNLEPKELRSVEIIWLSFIVPEIKAFTFLYF